MAHLTSFKSAGAVGVLRHDERKETDKVQSRKNECIDNLKTHLNYNLAPKRTGKLMEHIRRVCDDNHVRLNNRKDLNVMCSWVITVPKVIPPQEQPFFFRRCYEFLKERYREQYVLSAVVHMDETTPHLHFCFIPVGYDSKNDRLTVSSKLVATRTELRSCQQELSNSLDKEFGYNLGMLNEATKDGNKTIQELKYKTAVEKIEKAEHKLENLQGRILKQEEVNAIKGKKTLTGGLKGVTYEEYLSLKKTAQSVNKAKKTVKKLKAEVEELKNERDLYKNKSESIDVKTQINHTNEINAIKSKLEKEKHQHQVDVDFVKSVLREMPQEARSEFFKAQNKILEDRKTQKQKIKRNRNPLIR